MRCKDEINHVFISSYKNHSKLEISHENQPQTTNMLVAKNGLGMRGENKNGEFDFKSSLFSFSSYICVKSGVKVSTFALKLHVIRVNTQSWRSNLRTVHVNWICIWWMERGEGCETVFKEFLFRILFVLEVSSCFIFILSG